MSLLEDRRENKQANSKFWFNPIAIVAACFYVKMFYFIESLFLSFLKKPQHNQVLIMHANIFMYCFGFCSSTSALCQLTLSRHEYLHYHKKGDEVTHFLKAIQHLRHMKSSHRNFKKSQLFSGSINFYLCLNNICLHQCPFSVKNLWLLFYSFSVYVPCLKQKDDWRYPSGCDVVC